MKIALRRGAALAAFALALVLSVSGARAHMTEELAKSLAPPGYDVGAPLPEGHAFPLLRAGRTEGYIFDTLDYAPVPGFSGTPIEMVVALDDSGKIMDVHLVSQSEPVFLHGLGVDPFIEFLTQYRGKNIKGTISVGSLYGERAANSGDGVVLDGVAKASASVRIANVTILSSAIAVARAHMAGAAPQTGALVQKDVAETLDWPQLLARGYVGRLYLTNADVQKGFADSIAAGFDPEGTKHPDETFAEIYFALADIPSVGVSLFGRAEYDRLMAYVEPGDHVIALLSPRGWPFLGPNFVRGSEPERIRISQGGFSVGGRDLTMDFTRSDRVPPMREIALLRVPGSVGFDPASPWTVSIAVERSYGQMFPVTDMREFTAQIAYPEKLFTRPEANHEAAWLAAWRAQWKNVAALVLLLAVLTAVLARQRRATADMRAFRLFRHGFLAIVLIWIGWIAQGQLSIVTVLGLVNAIFHHSDMGFLLYDPVSLILWLFTLACLFFWGRGSFCGWLCPFGALQEFAALLGQALRLPRRRPSVGTTRRALWIKYGVLVMLVAGALYDSALADTLAEAEPFKTAITLGFRREPGFVAYAAGLLLWGLVYYKPFCRFLCPLGASLALAGRARRWNWIPRRNACGAPCRLCEHRCEYGAIGRDGAVDYAECFQCLDCVAIYHDRKTCVPLVLEDRRARKGAI